MPTGTVKWFDSTKGYGFIEPEDNSPDVFVHASAVERAGLGTLREGDRVRYEPQPGRNGKESAEDLSRLGGADHAPPRHPEPSGPTRGVGATQVGTVKWFDTAKGFRIHRARRWLAGRLRSHLRGRTGGARHASRRTARELRAAPRPERQVLRREPLHSLLRPPANLPNGH